MGWQNCLGTPREGLSAEGKLLEYTNGTDPNGRRRLWDVMHASTGCFGWIAKNIPKIFSTQGI